MIRNMLRDGEEILYIPKKKPVLLSHALTFRGLDQRFHSANGYPVTGSQIKKPGKSC